MTTKTANELSEDDANYACAVIRKQLGATEEQAAAAFDRLSGSGAVAALVAAGRAGRLTEVRDILA